MTEKEETDAKQAPKKNFNQGHRSRMRKRYLTCGFSGFQEHEILELLLFYALPRVNTNPIAHQLLKEFHSLAGVLDADPVELQKIPGIREQAAVFLNMLPELFRYYQLSKETEQENRKQLELDRASFMATHLQHLYTGVQREQVAVLLLDNSLQIIQECFLSEGSVTISTLSIRSIAELAFKYQAACVILAHNHPGGSASPSQEDCYVTKQVYTGLQYLNVALEDHYIRGMQHRLYRRWNRMSEFRLHAPYQPTGDQPEAIAELVNGIRAGDHEQTLLGVTGSGKTFTIANVIAQVNKPTLVLAHNKILAAQLCSEFKEFFPENAVEYFVSYYDYYQPEAYVPSTDSYIEKDSSINDEIDKLRHSATTALAERRDVIIVASVSCIYSLGSPEEYRSMVVSVRKGMEKPREQLLKELVAIQYERNDVQFVRNKFRVRGDVVEIFPSSSNHTAIRVEYFGDEIDRICEVDTVTGNVTATLQHAAIFPASHYVVSGEHVEQAISEIETELQERVAYFEANHRLIEAQRIAQRTHYDMEMLREIGFCSGIENYSRILAGRPAGSVPYTLLDHFPNDFLLVVDESHVTLPQVRAMSAGDHARKATLVDYGFRLPSAFDNRPLNFDEFYERIPQAIYVSATPGEFEKQHSSAIVEQVIRPTGLLDPMISVRPVSGQIEDLYSEIQKRVERNERVLITTLTKKMAEDLTAYLEKLSVRVQYLHHDVDTVKRMEIIRDLRLGNFDVLVGINLLREGLDIPEVSLVAILDADKEGFLRSETALIQTIGRAARNANGMVILYADEVTGSMERAITETERRRKKQMAYNTAHHITPKTITKAVRDVIEISTKEEVEEQTAAPKMTEQERKALMETLTAQMKEAAKLLEFEHAAYLRDKIQELRGKKA